MYNPSISVPSAPRRLGVARSLAALGVVALIAAFFGVSTRSSAAPVAPTAAASAPFEAPTCPGETELDPATSGSATFPNLRMIEGQRLISYNAGHVVPLYGPYGDADPAYKDSLPPTCATQADENGDPVSNWLFCTDYHSATCNTAGPNGELQYGTDAVNPYDMVGANSKISADDQRIIAWLVNNSVPYTGTPGFLPGVTTATADGNTEQREALQVLVWCISDPVADVPENASEENRKAACDASMDSDRRAEILEKTQNNPTLALASPPDALTPGEVAQFTLTTNIRQTPIALSTSPSVSVTLCPGTQPATLSGTTLTVDAGTGDATVMLCLTSASPATVQLEASAVPVASDHIDWHQSRNNENITKPCQVYAVVRADMDRTIAADGTVTFAADTTTTTEGATTTTEGATTTTTAGGTTTSAGGSSTTAGGSSTTGATATTTSSGSGLSTSSASNQGGNSALARTGTDGIGRLSVIAGLCLVGGAAMIAAARRRQQV